MASRRPEDGKVATNDLESTAKLPVLDVVALGDLDVEDESHLRTTVLPADAFSTSDTHPGIPILKEPLGFSAAEARVVVHATPAPPAGVVAGGGAARRGSRALAEAEAAMSQLLERQADLLREIQDVRDEADARYLRLEADLDAARRLGEDLDAMRREADACSLASEQRCAALESEFAAARVKLAADAAAAELAMRSRLEEESFAVRQRLEADLLAARGQLETDAGARQQRDAELVGLRAQHEGELSRLRQQGDGALVAARQQHTLELAAIRQQHALELEAVRQQQALELAAAREESARELAALREQGKAQAVAHEAALQLVRAEGGELRRELADLGGLMSLNEDSLAQARDDIARLERTLADERAAQLVAVQSAAQAEVGSARELDLLRAELGEMRARAALQVEALHAAESRRGIWASLLGDAESAHDVQLREARDAGAAERARSAAVQAELEARVRSHGALELALRADAQRVTERLAELETRHAALQSSAAEADIAARAALDAARAEREALQASNARLATAVDAAAAAPSQQSVDEQAEAMRALQGELRRGGERITELESDLRAAEDQVNRLEGDLRAKILRLEEIGRPARLAGVPSEGAAGGSRRRDDTGARGRGSLDPGSSGESLMPADSAFSGAGATASADGITRYFVLMDGDTEIVHVLGRRTTLGRGLDNDVRIDTKFISRHHAVVLAGPSQTVIEDLRSTNGVLVNGRRVTRSALRDGDIVHVGKTKFRFVQRQRERERER